ncbi:MAG: prepilin-type N-terminal cleavage/methylation domain-containing protein, partial [Lysinibacillus sp.]
MLQQMKKRMKNEKGLTLIELLAVIVILAIIAAIA